MTNEALLEEWRRTIERLHEAQAALDWAEPEYIDAAVLRLTAEYSRADALARELKG